MVHWRLAADEGFSASFFGLRGYWGGGGWQRWTIRIGVFGVYVAVFFAVGWCLGWFSLLGFLDSGGDADVSEGDGVVVEDLNGKRIWEGLEEGLHVLDEVPVLLDAVVGTHFDDAVLCGDGDQRLDPVQVGFVGSLALVELELVLVVQPQHGAQSKRLAEE